MQRIAYLLFGSDLPGYGRTLTPLHYGWLAIAMWMGLMVPAALPFMILLAICLVCSSIEAHGGTW